MICELLHTTPSNLTKQDRTTKNVFNRAIVVKLMRERGMMDRVIADAINRHRTTIIWAYQMANAMYDTNETFRDIKTGGVYQELRGGDITLLPNVDQRLYFLSDAYVSEYRDWETDRKSTRLNSSHSAKSRMPSSA